MLRVIYLLGALLLTGCAPVSSLVDVQPKESVPSMEFPEYTVDPDGSLFSANYGMALFQDRRAFRLGDILTVELDEQTRSSKKAGTSYGKDSNVGIGVPLIAGKAQPKGQFTLEGERDFKGSSSSSQQNSLSGSITVMVAEVLPNGGAADPGRKVAQAQSG